MFSGVAPSRKPGTPAVVPCGGNSALGAAFAQTHPTSRQSPGDWQSTVPCRAPLQSYSGLPVPTTAPVPRSYSGLPVPTTAPVPRSYSGLPVPTTAPAPLPVPASVPARVPTSVPARMPPPPSVPRSAPSTSHVAVASTRNTDAHEASPAPSAPATTAAPMSRAEFDYRFRGGPKPQASHVPAEGPPALRMQPTPSPASSANNSASQQGLSEGSFRKGCRVQALHDGQWHSSTVILPASENVDAGYWVVQCDVDSEGVYTSTVAVRPDVGSRLEVLYEGAWYAGRVVGAPEDDPLNLQRWFIQCDADAEGCVTYGIKLRPLQESDSEHASPEAPPEAELESPDASPEGPEEGRDVKVHKVQAGGASYYVVVDSNGEELGSFGKEESLKFELQAKDEALAVWLAAMPTYLLPGVLMLLVDEVQERGTRMKSAEARLGSTHAPDDYHFFGLSLDCPDQELERAYRRVAARLHPDKGGDVHSFDAMRQRYKRLKEFRKRGGQATQRSSDPAPEAPAPEAAAPPPPDPGEAKSAGHTGAIRWDPKDRASMESAHEELRLQLRYIADKTETSEREIFELERRLSMRHCLEDDPEMPESRAQPEAGLPRARGPSSSGIQSEDIGTCLLCLEQLPADPRQVVNPCASSPQCRCLLHLRCFLFAGDMNDHLRRCMICKQPARPDLVEQARIARSADLG